MTVPFACISTRPASKNNAVESARDHDVVSFDLPLHPRALAQHQRLAGDDRSLDFPFDSKRPRKLQRALHANGLIEKAGPLAGFGGAGIL